LTIYIAASQNLETLLTKGTDPLRRLRGSAELGEQLSVYQKMYPNVVWATENRMNLSLFVYYTNPRIMNFQKWNPGKQIKDHFDLITDLNSFIGHDLIMVTNYYHPQSLVSFGDKVEEIGCIYYSPYPDFEKKFRLILIKNFRGY
jgi:hypothetical protein